MPAVFHWSRPYTRLRWVALSLCTATFAAGCPSDESPQDTDDGTVDSSGSTSDDETGPFVQVQEGIEGGVMLSGHSSERGMVVVGGRLSSTPGSAPGGPGTLYWVRDQQLCRQVGITEQTLWWIEGSGDGTWFAVGERGTILRFDGTTVHDESVDTEAILYGVRASDPPIAVGGDPFGTQQGEIWQRGDDGTWSLLHTELPGVAFKISGDWIVGVGVAWQLQSDGTLVEHHPPNDARLLTVRARAADDVWAVGGAASAVVLHWDGTAWEEIPFDTACGNGGLNGVWTAPGEDVWVAGFFGAMARYDGEAWTCSRPPATFEHLHATWEHDGQMWWGGGALLSSGGNVATLGRHGIADPLALPVVDCTFP